MDFGDTLRHSRRRAGLSQRELAKRTDIAQTVIARIESGQSNPRVDTLDKLLRACGDQLTITPRKGIGVDRTLIRSALDLSPRARLETASRASDFFERIRGRALKQ